MNVIQFIASRGYGGAEKVFIDICNELIKSKEINLEVILLENNEIQKYLDKKIVVHLVKDYSRFNPFLYIQLIKYIREKIIHTHGSKATKVIHSLKNFINITHIATKHNIRKGAIFNKIKNVTAVSKDVQNSIKGTSKLIYNGITPISLENNLQKDDVFTIVTIGRLDKIKGFDLLIKDLKDLEKNFKLLIIGDGAEKTHLNTLIDEYNLQNKIFLMGFKDDIPNLMNKSHMVLISSQSEGFSLVALEALFYCDLLVSNKVGICKEILDENFLINDNQFSKKIATIIDNYDKYKLEFDVIKNEYQDEFLLENIVLEYIKYYKTLI